MQIPDDVSLIGFDNIEFASILYPPLTTIHQPKYEMGQAAVEILLRLAGDKDRQMPEERRLGVQLIVRKSCRKRA
jgi:DNA-binding LacI/PurR family transcriptional regulator